MNEITEDEAYIDGRMAEVEGLIEKAGHTPTISDITRACEIIASNFDGLDLEARRKILEALKIKIHTGKPVRIEGVLPVLLQPTKWWLRVRGNA